MRYDFFSKSYKLKAQSLRGGTSLIDVTISLGIIVFLFGGIYLVYFSLIDATSNIEARTVAVTVLNREIEFIRNLSYQNVGTMGGAPSGVLSQQKQVSYGGYQFTIQTTVRNIDDPFDGALGGVPNDTAPADYKLVELQISCLSCARFSSLALTTTVAPKNLESASSTGSLFVNVFDAGGIAVSAATVHVVNASTTPIIDLTDTTNVNGILQLVGIPTSTQSYQITVSKDGYSSEKTYAIGDTMNPNPLKPHATVAVTTVTNLSFSIDRVSQLTVSTSDLLCAALPGKSFTIQGAKLIGTAPDVLKFSTSTATDASGIKTVSNLEWDTYSFVVTASSSDIAGTIPFLPITINPASTGSLRFVLKSPEPDSLLVTVSDAAGGAGIQDAVVSLTKAGFLAIQSTGHGNVTHTDWSSGNYATKDSGVDADSIPGSLILLANASSTYSTTTISTLTSKTIDVGSTTATYFSVSWNPTVQPPSTGATSAKFQLAANNDNATWNYRGPDGTAATYYTASSTVSGLNNNRYLRYKVFLSTQDQMTTSRLNDITFEFYSVCVPPAQTIFTNLSAGTYTVSVSAPNYLNATSTVVVGSAYQSIGVNLTHQ